MIENRRRQVGILALSAIFAASVVGCATEYHGYDSGIDGVLWRQIAAFEDPLLASIYEPLHETVGIPNTTDPESHPAAVDTPAEYLAGIDKPRWDGTARSLPQLEIEKGGVILYDVASRDSTAMFSLFIASGPRPNVPTDEGRDYSGPSEVYTCYSIKVDFGMTATRVPDRTAFTECPSELVGLLAEDAAFASAEVFEG
jgi:hypothetical protein